MVEKLAWKNLWLYFGKKSGSIDCFSKEAGNSNCVTFYCRFVVFSLALLERKLFLGTSTLVYLKSILWEVPTLPLKACTCLFWCLCSFILCVLMCFAWHLTRDWDFFLLLANCRQQISEIDLYYSSHCSANSMKLNVEYSWLQLPIFIVKQRHWINLANVLNG